jgi:HSP20 family protein
VGVTDKNVDVYLFIPGMDPAQIDVVVEKKLLSVAGNRLLEKADDKPGDQTRKERYEGQFKRVITLPEDVDTDSADAVYQDGVLHISMAKPLASQPRQVQISVH